MILLIDNYDSFTYNLYQYLGELGADVRVRRNDAIEARDVLRLRPSALVLSPGPGRPEEAGNLMKIVSSCLGRVPMLGVCLGHQAIGSALGGRIVRAPRPMHGKTSVIRHDGRGLFRGLPNPLEATRYHSLVVDAKTMPKCLKVSACSEDGLVMGARHRRFAAEGVQFHPESAATADGKRMLRNFLEGSR